MYGTNTLEMLLKKKNMLGKEKRFDEEGRMCGMHLFLPPENKYIEGSIKETQSGTSKSNHAAKGTD